MANTAARVANYLRKNGGSWATGTRSIVGAMTDGTTSGTSVNSILVEIYLGPSIGWTKVPVRYESGISISRGRPSEGQNSDTATATLTLDNRSGSFSPRNPNGPYYGFLGRNTPLRIQKNGQYRFYGEVSEWPQRWDTTGTDIFVPIVASSLLRRLGASADVATKSAMYRFHTAQGGVLNSSGIRVFPTDYWPMEDPNGSTGCFNAVGGANMAKRGSPNFASYTGYQGSDALPNMTSSIGYSANVRAVSTNGFVVDFLMSGNLPLEAAFTVPFMSMVFDGGTARELDVYYNLMGSDQFTVQLLDDSGTPFSNSSNSAAYPTTIATQPQAYQYIVKQNGAKVNVTVLGRASTDTTWQTLLAAYDYPTSNTLGRLTSIRFGTLAGAGGGAGGTGGTAIDGIGHVAIYDDLVQHDISNGPGAYLGEAAGTRFARILSEEGYTARIVGNASTSVPMGYQTHDTLISLLRSCENSDTGILYEPRDYLGLAYRTVGGLSNQAASITLNYANAELAGDLQPTDDDLRSSNDVTVEREGGNVGRFVDSTSPMGTAQPPSGIGLYQNSTTLILDTDDRCVQLASWLVHLGTVNEARYPQITIDMNNPRFVANPDLQSRALVADVGDRITVTNPPSWMPPESISQIIQGYDETFDQFEHTITFNCAPESPYHTAITQNATDAFTTTTTKLDSSASTLNSPMDTTATTASVAVASGSLAWSTSGGLPLDLMVGGERMTATAIANSTTQNVFFGGFSDNSALNPETISYTGAGAQRFGVTNGVGFFCLGVADFIGSGTNSLSWSLGDSPAWGACGAVYRGNGSAAIDQLSTLAQVASGTTITTTWSVNPQPGATVLVFVQNLAPTITVVDNGSTPTTFTQDIVNFNGANAYIFRADNVTLPASGSYSVTVTTNVAHTLQACGISYTGMAGGAPIMTYGANNTNNNPRVSLNDLDAFSPQSFTVTRSVNGIVKTHNRGEKVSLFNPNAVALTS